MPEYPANQSAIFVPFIGMMVLTLLVWLYMYYRRLTYLVGNNIAAQSVATPDKLAQVVPEKINLPSNNLKNLFELPILFYALCLYLFLTSQVDMIHLVCAWTFLIFRVIHSATQCTINIVTLRFITYLVASLALWFMVIRSAWLLI